MKKRIKFGKRILSGLLAVSMFVSVVQMPVFSEDSAVNVKLSELTEIGYENDGIEILYPYYYQPDTNKVTFTENDSVEFDKRDSSNTNFSAKVYREGKWAGVIDKDNDYTTVLPEGEWLLSSFAATTNSGEIRFVHRYVNPEIFLVKNSSNILHLLVGNADSDGMATAIYSEEDELYPFFSGLDIKVRKTVDKLEAGSFCIYVKGKNGEDYTDFFEYYDSPLTNIYWQRGKWLNSYFNCLGAIEDDEVKIYFKPNYDLLYVKTSVIGGKGGSISSADTYYKADSTEEQTYTVTPDEGYEVDDIEVTSADGNPVTVNLDKSTGEFTIKPSDLRKADTTFNVAEIKVTFSKKHEAHCICGGTTDYDGHDAHTNIEWQSWRSADSLPTVAGNYYLKNDVILPAGTYTLPDGVNICLNGYRITGESVNKTNIKVNGTLGITECSAAGTGFIGSLSLTESGSKLVMYSGRLLERFPVNINGGTQFTMTGSSENIGILSINNDADFTMSGNAVNGHTIKLIETDSEAKIVFSGRAYGGYVRIQQPRYDAGFSMSGKAKIETLIDDSLNDKIRLTMEDDAEISNVGIDFLSLSLSGNAKLGSASSKYTIEDENCVLKDKVQLIGTVTYNNSELTLQDNASVTGELIVTGSGSASRVVMKGNSAINGKLTCKNASVSFEMRDNATIDTIDVGISTVYGTVTCTGEIISGVFEENGTVINNGKITSGIFYGTVIGNGTIEDSATVDIIFETNGGSAVSTQKVLRGQKAVTPGYCKKPGYTLEGWYKNDTVYDFTEPVIEGFTLTAQWTANTYTVSFDSDGSTAVGDKTLGWNDKVLDGIETPTRSNGYAFSGWKYGDISVDADTTYADLVADDTIASITLTAQWLDIEKPTGEITLGENNWNSFLNGITFGLFFKETKTVTITAADNSGKTVKIEYLLSDKEMSLSELANSTFTVYTDTFSIASDNNYVIYVRLTDEAGNEEYISSDGFVIDKTAPVIEGYEDGQTVNICGSKLLTFIETNLDSVTVNGNPISLSMGKYATLSHSGSAQVVVATDKAGNTTTVTFNIASDHDFNFETQKCNHCGQNALVELTVDGVTKLYDSYSSAQYALPSNFENAEIKLLGDITESSVSYFSKGKLVFDLNGFTFNNGSGEFYVRKDVDMTITGGGTMNGQVYVMNGGTLTVDNDGGEVKNIWQSSGNLKVISGNVYKLIVGTNRKDTETERKTELCGGTYDILTATFEGITCADLLGKDYRFDGISYTAAQKDELDDVTVVLCNHESYDENGTCIGCGKQMEAVIERNGVTTRYETLTEALNAAENGDTLKLLTDVDAGYGVTIENKNITFDLNGKRLYNDGGYQYILSAADSTLTVKNGTVDAIGYGTNAILADNYKNVHMTLENVTAKVNNEVCYNGAVFVGDGSTVVIKSGDYQGLFLTANATVTLEGGTFRPYKESAYSAEEKSIFYKIDETNDESSRDCMTLLGDGCTYADENGNPVRTFGGFDTVVTVRNDVAAPSEPVAKIGDTEYLSLQEAIDAANEGDTITLLRDLDLGNGTVLLEKDIYKDLTIDLDSHTISAYGAYLVYMKTPTDSNVTIKNGTLDGSKCCKYGGAICIMGSHINSKVSRLTLKDITAEGGTILNSTVAAPVVGARIRSTVIFDGGTYTGGVVISGGNAVLKSGTFKKGNNTYSIMTEASGKYLSDYLDEDCQFWDGDNILDLSSETQTEDVTVHLCDHIWVDGKCTVCQKVCDHGMAEDGSMTASVCPKCKMAAVAEVDTEPVKYFFDFDKALDCAMANAGSTLKLLADIDEDVTVTSGTFTLDATGRTISGDLNVESGAKLTVNGGTINKNTVCAKGGKLTATGGTSFKGTIDCIGEGSFTFCGFEGAFTGAGSINVYYSVFKSTIKVSNEFYAISSSSENEITIDVDKNGKLGLIMGFYAGNIKSEGELNISDTNHSGIITAESGSKLKISRGKLNSVEINENVDVTLSGGSFGTIKVSGKQLIDCLEEEIMEGDGYAFVDKDGNVIDGRVNSATDVKIISDHVHDCVWDMITHEKRCACGYVGEIDTESPVISGIEDGETYYGATDFTVTDDNDFTVSIDDVPVQSQLGVWTITPDNNKHTISVIDVAGNAVSISVTVLKIYDITLPSGEGYTVTGADTAGHGTEYEFTVSIADGYSRTKSYRVLVNGTEISRSAGDESNDIFRIDSVDSDMIITVEGVADIAAPDVEIEIGADNFKAFMNTVTFGLFFKDTQIVTVTAKDGGSGIKTVEYLLSETVFNDEGSVTGDFITLTLENGKAQFSLEPTQKAFVYVRATDVSGNIQVINSEGVVIYTDSEAVTEAVDFTMRDSNDVSFDVKLNGNTVSALYNGDTLIDSGNYTVSEDGIITLKNAYLNTLAAGEYTIRVAYDPLGESYKNGDEPAMTSVKLTVGKRTALIDHNMSDKKYYDGKSIPEPSYKTDSDGAVIFEYKLASADDLTYITAAPKNVGVYTIRITIPETDVYNAVSSTMTYEILAKEVTISGATVEATKVYDGTTDAKITSEGTLSGVLDGDSVTIAIGKANYSDKNVGVGKTVTFTNFALSGNDAMNYTPAVQPESTTAGISAKELTITDLRVKDKQYDGKNTAEIDGTPTLVGVADGDVLELVNGIPTFDIVSIGKNIPISFTTFRLSGDDVTVGNYTLTQPTGITANITEYTADGSEYRVNSNDWINTDFVITANEGWKLSLSKDIDGEWADTLTASDETDNGSLTFYVKNTATGAISEAVTELYKIDRTAPTGEVRLNKRTAFGEFISTVTFGMLFGNDVDVELTAADNASGVKSVMYFKSDKALSETEIRTVTDWTDKSDFSIEAKDADRVIVYVRIEDNAGNIAYISSDGMTFDTTAPAVTGVENGKTYYVTKKVTVDDGNLESVTLNGDPVGGEFTLAGDTDMTYVIRAVDKVGNVTEYTVHMKPISSVTDAIRDITADNVKSDDAGMISSVERQLLEIDSSEATDDEQNKLSEAAEKCEALKDRIAEVTDEGNRLDDGVNGYDIGKVTSDDIADIEKLIDDIDKLLDSDNLTDTQRDDLEDLRDKAKDMLDRITAAEDVADAEEIKAVDGITEDNVKLDDKDALEKAKKVLESAIRDFDGNYTDEERKDLDAKLETVKAALASIDNVEKAIELISRLPSLDNATLGDKSEVDLVKNMIAGLSENEKAMLGITATEKVDALEEKIRKLAENPVSPDTGYESDPISWAALLFISGGVVTGTAIINKKKKRSVR